MNNLKELFEIQAGLDAEILNNHPVQEGEDRLEKKHAALLVELGEMFNEWRAFKFWSTDQKPRKEVDCVTCRGKGKVTISLYEEPKECEVCDGTGTIDKLLGELVDCLHFVISIGLEHDAYTIVYDVKPYRYDSQTLELQFIFLMRTNWSDIEDYEDGFALFLGFCERLGYTWEQITAAYLEKNQENHYRQMRGY